MARRYRSSPPTRSPPATSRRGSGASRPVEVPRRRLGRPVGGAACRRRRDPVVREPALRPGRARAAPTGSLGRGGRRAADRGGRRARPATARRRRRQGRGATFTGAECFDWAGGRTGPATRPRATSSSRRRRSTRWRRRSSRLRVPRSRIASSTASTPPRPPGETGAANSRRACSSSQGRRLRRPLRSPRRSSRRRPSAADRGAPPAVRHPRPALRCDAEGRMDRRRRRTGRRAP